PSQAWLAARPFEEPGHGELLVRREAVLRSRFDEDRLADVDRDALVPDLEDSGAFEADIDLVVVVRLLAVRLRCDEDVDAELEAVGLVDDLVAAACAPQTLDGRVDAEGVHGRDATCVRGIPDAGRRRLREPLGTCG